MPGRIYSFFDNPNNFAEILVMLLPLVFALLIVSKNWRVKVLSLAALAVGVVSLGATLVPLQLDRHCGGGGGLSGPDQLEGTPPVPAGGHLLPAPPAGHHL